MAMTNAELEELATALYTGNMVNAGVMAAHRAVIDALIGAIGLSLPPLLGAIGDNLDALQSEVRKSLEPDSLRAFDNTVAAFQHGISVLQR